MARSSRRKATPPTRRRGSLSLTVGFGIVVVAAVALLAAAVVLGPLADAWHPMVSVNGQSVNRSELRARMVLDSRIIDARRVAARALLSGGRMSPSESDRIGTVIDAWSTDPLRAAIDGLVEDLVIRAEARARNLAPTVDPQAELLRAAGADAAFHVRAVTIAQPNTDATPAAGAWPAPASNGAAAAALASARAAAIARARDALASGTSPADAAAALTAAGWQAAVVDTWIPATGALAGLPDGFVASVRAATSPGTLVVDAGDADTTPIAAVGSLVDSQPASAVPGSSDGIDAGALQAWAEARADERALGAALVVTWQTTPQPLIRAAELVIGSATATGVEGEYRSFAHVVVGQLPAAVRGQGSDADAGARIAAELRALSSADRVTRFDGLIAAANATNPADGLHTSGETAFYTHDQVVPALADLAFAATATTDDVLGPVTTPAGVELFILRATFHGTLDDRSNAALVEARTTSDLLAMAHRVSPAGEWPRADGSLWRAEAEVQSTADARSAYLEAPIGSLSSPFILDGEIVLVQPLERTTGPVPPGSSSRLAVRGFDAWLASRIQAAAVTRDPEPLPGIAVESAGPSATADPFASVTGIPTPQLPRVSIGP